MSEELEIKKLNTTDFQFNPLNFYGHHSYDELYKIFKLGWQNEAQTINTYFIYVVELFFSSVHGRAEKRSI